MTVAESYIDLIRHGQTQTPERICGSTDVSLSDRGREQMLFTAEQHGPWDAIWSSPLERCRLVAQRLSKEDEAPLTLLEGLREIDMGDWEDRSFHDVLEEDGDHLARFWEDPDNHPPPNGELMPDFMGRVGKAWEQILADIPQGGHSLVVCHGGVIRALVGLVLGMPTDRLTRLDVPHASLSRIKVVHEPQVGSHLSLLYHGVFDEEGIRG